ncbi:hypothetical protein [Nocardia sp. BMG51109]|nr:hypothetical protein [Nocardia sp. BMG51109]
MQVIISVPECAKGALHAPAVTGGAGLIRAFWRTPYRIIRSGRMLIL